MELLSQVNTILALPVLWHGHGDPGGWWWVWRLGMFLFWFGLLAFIFFFGCFGRGRWRYERSGAQRARDILAERYAAGEIGLEEYRERLNQLELLQGKR